MYASAYALYTLSPSVAGAPLASTGCVRSATDTTRPVLPSLRLVPTITRADLLDAHTWTDQAFATAVQALGTVTPPNDWENRGSYMESCPTLNQFFPNDFATHSGS